MTHPESGKRWPVMLAAAIGGILGAAALIWARYPAEEAPAFPAGAPAATQEAPVAERPATPSGPSIPRGLGDGAETSTGIALTDNQELIADSALRKVMDAYLLGRGSDSGLPALITYLNRRLPANAAREAGRLATSYNAYLSAHDQLLAVQNLGSPPDLNRLIGWQRQRQQLRERMLGAQVPHEWFGNEDAYFTQALEEMRQRGEGTAPPSDSGDEDQARHAQHMRQALMDAVRPYGDGANR